MYFSKFTSFLFKSAVTLSVVYCSFQYIHPWVKKRLIATRCWVAKQCKTSDTLEHSKDKQYADVTLSEEDKYKLYGSKKFSTLFVTKDAFNINIDPCFYDNSKYQTAIGDTNNDLELSWKRRILVETTPRGNVIMYYDAFKRGFMYYSDQTIPYSILNIVAMKYVMRFRCLDFFVDEQYILEGNVNSLLDVLRETVPPTVTTPFSENTLSQKQKIDVTKGPFAKLKKYSTSGGVNKKTDKTTSKTMLNTSLKITEPEKMKNKIIYGGKMVNFSFLNRWVLDREKEKKKESVRNTVLSYRDYKFWQSPQSSTCSDPSAEDNGPLFID